MTVTIVEEARPVTGGVDTHADTHVAAALDSVGGLLASGSSRPPRLATPACWAGWAGSGPCAWSGSRGLAVTAPGWPAPKGRDGAVEAIRTLMVARRSAAGERTRTINQARALVLTGP